MRNTSISGGKWTEAQDTWHGNISRVGRYWQGHEIVPITAPEDVLCLRGSRERANPQAQTQVRKQKRSWKLAKPCALKKNGPMGRYVYYIAGLPRRLQIGNLMVHITISTQQQQRYPRPSAAHLFAWSQSLYTSVAVSATTPEMTLSKLSGGGGRRCATLRALWTISLARARWNSFSAFA